MSLSDTWHAVRKTGGAKARDVLPLLIMLTAVVAMALVGYGQVMTSRITSHQSELLPIASGVGQRVSTSNLALTQALAGDQSVSLQTDVFKPLDEAQAMVETALQGGKDLQGDPVAPATDPAIAKDLKVLDAYVQGFRADVVSRWQHRERVGAISEKSDTEYNRLYSEVLAQVDTLSRDVQHNANVERVAVQHLNMVVLGILALVFAGMALFVRRSRRAIVLKNAELERRVRERTTELASSEARTTAIVNTAVDAIITIDEQGAILRVNPSTERIFGWDEGTLIGKDVNVLMAEEDGLHHGDYLRRYAETGQPHILGVGREAVARRKDGTIFPIDLSVSEAKVEGGRFFVGVIRDITERKRVEAELQAAKAAAEEAATHDPLTGLWNHNRILEILMEEMARSDRQGTEVSLIMADLDHFKQVNDHHGHVVGDEVLREVAARLGNAVRTYDSVGRFGGEEFMIVLPGTRPEDAERAAERIRGEVGQEPVLTSVGPLAVTTSLGVVTRQGELINDATALLVAADTALYESKEAGRNRVTIAQMVAPPAGTFPAGLPTLSFTGSSSTMGDGTPEGTPNGTPDAPPEEDGAGSPASRPERARTPQ